MVSESVCQIQVSRACMKEHSDFGDWRICSASRVVAKLIYIVGHISLSTEAKFPMTIGVGVVVYVMFE